MLNLLWFVPPIIELLKLCSYNLDCSFKLLIKLFSRLMLSFSLSFLLSNFLSSFSGWTKTISSSDSVLYLLGVFAQVIILLINITIFSESNFNVLRPFMIYSASFKLPVFKSYIITSLENNSFLYEGLKSNLYIEGTKCKGK